MGWIRVESLRLDIARPVREQTSIGCFLARKLIEPILEGKANEATYVSHAPFPEWVLAASVYRKGDRDSRSLGRLSPRLAFEGLELCDGKLSRTVLRGLGASDGPRLPGLQ